MKVRSEYSQVRPLVRSELGLKPLFLSLKLGLLGLIGVAYMCAHAHAQACYAHTWGGLGISPNSPNSEPRFRFKIAFANPNISPNILGAQ